MPLHTTLEPTLMAEVPEAKLMAPVVAMLMGAQLSLPPRMVKVPWLMSREPRWLNDAYRRTVLDELGREIVKEPLLANKALVLAALRSTAFSITKLLCLHHHHHHHDDIHYY